MRHLFNLVQGATVVLAFGLRPCGTTQPAPGRIEQVGSLGTPRSVHTATALASGRLLVAGGMASGGASLASAELIDMSAARAGVEALPPMAHARAGHTATPLADGRVVLAGGYDGSYLGSVEVFDPARRRFLPLGELGEGRSGHTATLLRDGRILMVGGVGRGWTFLSSAEVLDPRSGRSEPVGPMSVARESHTATLLPDGRVLIVGGHRGRREAMEVYASAEVYDPAARRFHPAAGRLATPRHKHDAVLLANGSVLVLGGADRTDRRYFATTEVYDPAAGVFKPGPSMASTRYKFQGTAIRLANGDLLVPSGARQAELLERRSFTFRPVAGELPAAYMFSTATRLSTGDVAIVGGYDSRNQNTAGVWLFRAR